MGSRSGEWGPLNGNLYSPFPPLPLNIQPPTIYDFFHINAGAPNWRQASSAVADSDRLYDHLHGSRLHLACGEGYPRGIWLRCGDDGLDLQRIQFVVRALSDPRLAGGSVRPRRVLAIFVFWWSAFTAATSLALGKWSMYVVRFLFGMGEAGAFPTATRALSFWLPASERAAQGITHSGARLGAALTPPIAVALIASFGCAASFYIFGLIGALWAVLWLWYYRDRPEQHASVNAAEIAVIRRRQNRPSSGRAGSLGTDSAERKPAADLRDVFLLQLQPLDLPVVVPDLPAGCARDSLSSRWDSGHMVPLIAATIGDTVGGWLSDHLVGSSEFAFARRAVAITGFALAAACILPATLTEDRYFVGRVHDGGIVLPGADGRRVMGGGDGCGTGIRRLGFGRYEHVRQFCGMLSSVATAYWCSSSTGRRRFWWPAACACLARSLSAH